MDDDVIIKKILDYMHEQFKEEPRHTIMAEDLVRSLDLEINVARGYLQRLKDTELIDTPYRERDMYAITDLGIRNLETIYNPDYMKQVAKEHTLKRDKEENVIKREESNITLQKIGIISAIVLGALALIVAILK